MGLGVVRQAGGVVGLDQLLDEGVHLPVSLLPLLDLLLGGQALDLRQVARLLLLGVATHSHSWGREANTVGDTMI